MTDERKQQIRERAERATKGPWEASTEYRYSRTEVCTVLWDAEGKRMADTLNADDQTINEECDEDGVSFHVTGPCVDALEFAAASRTDIPDLLSEVDTLTARVGELEREAAFNEQLAKAKSSCGHLETYAYTEDGGRHIVCLLCERAELGRVFDEDSAYHHKLRAVLVEYDETFDGMDQIECVVTVIERAESQWRCFHCDEVFTDYEAARLHFGPHEGWEAACVQKSPDELRQVLIDLEAAQETIRRQEEKLDDIEGARENDMHLIRKEFGDDCTSVWSACDRHNNVKYELKLKLAENQGLTKACEQAENAIRHCPALKEWGPSTPEHLASRVATLCNLYADNVRTTFLLVEERERLREEAEWAAGEIESYGRTFNLDGLGDCAVRLRDALTPAAPAEQETK
jgi:hypothetical protein